MVIPEDVIPSPILFEWDEGNSEKNWLKHKVRIQEAEEAFLDPDRIALYDQRHSAYERRYILLGNTSTMRLLYIVLTVRKDRVRVISARDAHKKERMFYEKTTGIA